ncbi:MAG: SAM-dependent chlorinase/fluorinase [Bacteroidota bacterium]|nr:SAM-dependent chlorinase/fluorinase [Bacteroidota bacterium]
MPIITLTTDWNRDDFYMAAVKGEILQNCPNANVIDISHQVQAFNIAQAAFIIKNSFANFPKGTFHIIAVNSNSEKRPGLLAFSIKGQFFISYDSGIYGLIFKEDPDEIIELKYPEKTPSTFPELHIFAPIACKIAKAGKISSLGEKPKKFKKSVPLRATIDDSGITGSVIYIDSYKNAITNISRNLFERVGQNRDFEILIQSNHYKITRINSNYNETTMGEILAIFNSINLLEVAINQGNAADLLGLETGSSIRVVFKKK